jgi:hypothetical protein
MCTLANILTIVRIKESNKLSSIRPFLFIQYEVAR